ncbi:MAG: DUF4291 domain-containing protein [Propionicimonas sp.]
MTPPYRQIRADFDAETITVYQAFRPEIVEPALAAGGFVEPFSRTRMTWIKPSFRWMIYRSGWANKPGQERVVAVRISRAGFEELLRSACLTHHEPAVHGERAGWQAELERRPARVQWDPERTLTGDPLPYRSLQVGIAGPLVARYVDEWIVGLADLTDQLPAIRAGQAPLPAERPYPLPAEIAGRLGADA